MKIKNNQIRYTFKIGGQEYEGLLNHNEGGLTNVSTMSIHRRYGPNDHDFMRLDNSEITPLMLLCSFATLSSIIGNMIEDEHEANQKSVKLPA